MKELLDSLNSVSLGSVTLLAVLSALLTFIICFIIKKLLLKLFKKLMEKVKIAPSVKSFLNASINTVLWVLIVLITVDRLGVPITSLVAVLSVVGVALSLSLQGILENIFSGLTLLATKPIEVGEYVQIGDTAGTLKKMTLFYAVLVTADGKTVYIPNSTVTASMVINHSDQELRRVEFTIMASYDDEPDKVIASLIRAAKSVESVTDKKEPLAFVQSYSNSSIEYVLYAFTPNKQYLETKYEVMRQIFYTFRKDGVTMTYDHLNLHIVEDKTAKEDGKNAGAI